MALANILLNAHLLTVNRRTALVLDESSPLLLIRLALPLLDDEQNILPESLLDDWGHEIKGMELYGWILENGLLFPRAEIFGHFPSGKPAQCFLREIDLYARYPCYAYRDKQAPPESGTLFDVVLIKQPGVFDGYRTKSPTDLPGPFRRGRVGWWVIPDAISPDMGACWLDED